MAVTMQDIARDLNVSVVTVSKVLRNKGKISLATRQRVLQRAKKLNYQTNWIARSLVTRRTYTIGLLLPDFTHPFFAEIAKAVAETVRPHGYHVIISYFEENPQLEKSEAESLLARQVDGLILASAQPGPGGFENIRDRNTPFILIDRPIAGAHASFVGVDNQAIGQLATTHLISGVYANRAFARPRNRYRDRAHGRLPPRPGKSGLGGSRGIHRRSGLSGQYRLQGDAKIVARRRPGRMASSATTTWSPLAPCERIADAGLRVPDDIAVAGAGNVHYSDFSRCL